MSFKFPASIALDTLGVTVSGEMIGSTTFVTSLQSPIFLSITEPSTHSRTAKAASSRTSTTKSAASGNVDLVLLYINCGKKSGYLSCYA